MQCYLIWYMPRILFILADLSWITRARKCSNLSAYLSSKNSHWKLFLESACKHGITEVRKGYIACIRGGGDVVKHSIWTPTHSPWARDSLRHSDQQEEALQREKTWAVLHLKTMTGNLRGGVNRACVGGQKLPGKIELYTGCTPECSTHLLPCVTASF